MSLAPQVESESPPRPPIKTFDSLGNYAFRWYFFSMSGWFASMNMQMIARGWLAYDLTGSYAALGVVSLANAIPGMVLGLVGGVVADKVMKKQIIQVGQVVNMVVAFILAGLMLADLIEFWQLLVGAVAHGSVNAMLMPARQSMIPEFVDDWHLMNAIALNTAAQNVMRLTAPALAGLVIALAGPGWVYMLIAILYLWGAISMTRVPGTRPAARASQTIRGAIREGLNDLALGLGYMKREQSVRLVLTLNLAIVFFSQPYQMLLPGFASDILGAGAGRLGLLMSVTGVGALIGSLVIASLPGRNRGMILLISALIMGIALIAFSISTWFWVTVPIMLAVGFGQAGRQSLGNVLLQTYTEASYRGRMTSIYMLEFSVTAFMVFFLGAVANAVGIQWALGVSFTTMVVIVVATMLFSPRARNLQ